MAKQVRNARDYVERYPRLSAAICEARFRRKEIDCCWTDGRLDEDLARLRIRKFELDAAEFEVVFNFTEEGRTMPAWQRFDLKRLRPLNGYRKPFFLCPKCREPFDWMILKDNAWACRVCHNLCHRTQRLSADERRMLRMKELERQLQPIKNRWLRPKGMRHTTFDSLCAELRSLKAWAKTQPSRTVQVMLGEVLEARWELSSGIHRDDAS